MERYEKPNFKNFEISKKTLKDKRNGYKIYSSVNEFVLVEAMTAAEAIEMSGISTPVKVERTGLKKKYLLDDEELVSESVSFIQKEAQHTTMDELQSAEKSASEIYQEEEKIVNNPQNSKKEQLDIEA